MKRKLFSLLAIAVVGGILFTTSCTPEDTVSPVVTLKGDAVMSVDFGGTFTDPGTTVTDDVDKDLSVVVEGTVNVNAAGEYPLTYKATDAAGNVGTATRTVYVVHRKTTVAATYTAHGNCSSTSGPSYTIPTAGGTYSPAITPGSATAAIIFNNFGDFNPSININGTLTGNSGQTVQIPIQVQGVTIEGSAAINAAGTTITITYTAVDNNGTDTCTETWVKQ